MTDRASNTSGQNDDQLFKRMDEQERIFAPEQLPGNNLPSHEVDVDATAGSRSAIANEPPAAAPVAAPGNAPSAAAAPPNIGHDEHGGAPGDPETQANYPIGDDERR
jgi:hypothetical protein